MDDGSANKFGRMMTTVLGTKKKRERRKDFVTCESIFDGII
jgi:hypothetical protein